ncbi:ATP-binding cassette domain-containing protein [Solirubrobacter sp. CPCC 204708]|uniref:ATP-binding cassette domain-containing protein n=1 Tax=Solirubrobacter deserti TaxID=2282478 RepID=A0ABT4RLC0_9ACTN|nr:ATP-binding cassette domain-containing protein [Solirubrobacter deserti]MBE2318961.1 ATP-binding cassette domain-containing protein [Solirubrobacter deserti]MDA0139314.1 ATP-binding cassette domain-containing protein [Solirubrobacter deserti]
MPYTIEVEGLRKRFGNATVLDGVDLQVQAGEVFALLGPNGAGKTTTVRILTTLLAPDGGTARVAGHHVVREPNAVRAAISLTAQEAAVDGMLTGAENLRMMARLRGAPKGIADDLLERFDLVEAAGRRVESYSGGMRRRLDLAMSLVQRPQVLFLDEPTTGLDPRSRRAVWDAVTTLADEGVTVLLTTQYLEEADRLAQRIAVIDGGRVIEQGTAAELKARIASEVLELHFADRSQRIPVNGPDDVRRALEAHPDAERIELHQPSLDDVFLAVTR